MQHFRSSPISYITLLLILLATALPACGKAPEKQPWEEPFDAPGTWHLSSDAAATVAIDAGQLKIDIHQAGQVAWATAGRTFADFTLQVEATQLTGPSDNEYGVLVRMDENSHFYAFSISGDGYARVARYEEGAWTLLGSDWTPHESIRQGEATNLLELDARGSQFTFRVNGEEIATVEDATLTKGDLGLYAGAFDEAGVQIAFDNLQVTP